MQYHSTWGWPKDSLCLIFHAFVSSHLNHAGAGWQPYICGSNKKKLNRLQNRALRAITGQLVSAPFEALCTEAGVQSHRTTSTRLVARSLEKALWCPEDHPRRITAEEQVDHRTDRDCWSIDVRGSQPPPLLREPPPLFQQVTPFKYYE